MASVRCQLHRPASSSRKYVKSVEPVGYPSTALFCGLKRCTSPGLIWLERDELRAYADGQRRFSPHRVGVGLRAKQWVDLRSFSGRHVIVETFWSYGEQSHNDVRVRPVAEEGFSPDVRVQCSTEMRANHPVGTRFRLFVSTRRFKSNKLCLYSHYTDSYEVVSGDPFGV